MREAPSAQRGLLSRVNLEIRESMSAPAQIAVVAAGLLAGLTISALYLMLMGIGPGALLNEFVISIFTSARNVKSVLMFAAPLTLVGLAASVGLKARFWNIGIEGQLIFGAIGATLIATYDIGPQATRLPLMMVAAMLAGMAWIALPLFLRIRFEVSEIISTLLMNYVAFNFLLHLLYGPWKDPVTSFPNSQVFDAFERLQVIGWLGLHGSVLLALVCIVLMLWLFSVSRFGFLIRFVSANPAMARAMGIKVTAMVVVAALISGAVAGIAGFSISAGIDSRLTQSFFVGYGFSGILIGFLARSHPLAVVFFAFLMSILMVAGQTLQVFYQIPFAMVQLMQATIVICVAASEFFIRHRIHIVD